MNLSLKRFVIVEIVKTVVIVEAVIAIMINGRGIFIAGGTSKGTFPSHSEKFIIGISVHIKVLGAE